MQTQSLETSTRAQRWPWLLAVVWIAAVLVGLTSLWRYANTPSRASETLARWPDNRLILLNPKQPTLVMFAHPHCPCTRASVAELARIAAQCNGRFTGYVAFFKPADSEADWEDTSLKRAAEEIPGVQVVTDTDGRLARQFHATTSGHTLLYDPNGELLFSGGITTARGHSGDNLGEAAIVSRLTGEPSETSRTPVFGCPIIESE